MWAGRIISGIVAAFMVFDGVLKLFKPAPVLESFETLGYPLSKVIPIGILALGCAIVYAIPRSSILGAILLTGYLGGAVATHTRHGDPLFSHILFPVYVGILAWAGLYLRDERLRELVPLRK
jgi:hypothetical protein